MMSKRAPLVAKQNERKQTYYTIQLIIIFNYWLLIIKMIFFFLLLKLLLYLHIYKSVCFVLLLYATITIDEIALFSLMSHTPMPINQQYLL